MNKEYLQQLIADNLTQRQIALVANTSQTSVKHWLKKYDIKTKKAITVVKKGNKLCCRCKIEKHKSEFYFSVNRYSGMCKPCHIKNSVKKQSDKKKYIIEYKGGKCRHCGVVSTDNNYIIFDLHHRDPSTKERNGTKLVNWGLIKLMKEADKCDLLCSNCHRLEHFKWNNGIE